jgi:serine/threonine protein kinase
MTDLSGTRLGPYELRYVIGKGGMATVYRAYQPSVDREVAIKVLATELADDEEFVRRFEREARIIAGMQHPHILTVYDFGREGPHMYLVMRLMTGGSLALELRNGALAPERALKFTRQIASALDYAHQRGIVHRDLKPTNVLLDDSGNAYLTDFGIAKLLGGATVTGGLTVPGQIMGTPTYMAPEQWRAEPVDGRTDVYALGVIVYLMLLGIVPFAAETPHGLMYQHLDMQPPAPHTINPRVPLSVEPVIRKALAKRPEDRYASAGALADDLDSALTAPFRLPEQTQFEGIQPPVRPTSTDIHDRFAEDDLLTDQYSRRQPEPPSARAPQIVGPPPNQAPSPYYAPPPLRQPPAPEPQQFPYTPPVSESYRESDYVGPVQPFKPLSPWRSLWIAAAVLGGLIIVISVIMLSLTLLASNNEEQAEPTLAPTDTPVPTNPALLPQATILEPVDFTSFELGEPVTIRFSITSPQGITRVELRRFGQVLDSVNVANPTVYQGAFTYQPDATGLHTLEIVPFSGETEGIAAQVTIEVQ